MAYSVTFNLGRTDKKGRAYSARHNDRNFNAAQEGIDPSRTAENKIWFADPDALTSGISIDQYEHDFYTHKYGAYLNRSNQSAAEHGRKAKDIDEYRRSARGCPQEALLYIGDKEHHPEPEVLWSCAMDLICKIWNKYGTNVHMLDAALHLDEEGAPHVHLRFTWDAVGSDGLVRVNQTQALQDLGIERPDPTKPVGQTNNAKMTWTAAVRKDWEQTCQEHGLEICTDRKSREQCGLTKQQYTARKEAEAAVREAETKVARANEEYEALMDRIKSANLVIERQLGIEGRLKSGRQLRQLTEALDQLREQGYIDRGLADDMDWAWADDELE